ncbi:MAG: efflux RND transporter periplasmic adaptor subunit [Acidobacteria bacterium]|nr:efflux RND transporter periplasmic adaptor subunit [Acidobacteriota bacterium]
MKRIILFILLGLSACSRPQQPVDAHAASKAAEPVEVQVGYAERRRTDKSISVTGSLSADETVAVSSEVQGRVLTVPYDFGQSVRKGDILAELDKTEYQIQVDRSKAALAQALARLGLDATSEQTPTATPPMRQAQAQMEDARFKYESAQKLVKSGDISQERFQELEKAFRARQAAYEATRDEMRTQWASVDAMKVDVRLAEKRLRDTTIRAPFDGAIGERKVGPGQYVKDNAPIVTLVKTNPMRVRAEVPESAAAAVKIGTSIQFVTDAVPDARFSAIVREINPALNEQSRTLIVEARLNVTDRRLRPGMFVQVQLLLARDVETVVVPRRAVYSVAGLTKVFVVRDGKLVECKVPPGQTIGEWMEVPADQIRQGDAIALSDLANLTNGQPVRVRKAQAIPARERADA